MKLKVGSLEEGLTEVAHSWGLYLGREPKGPLSYAETALHEICHGVAFCMRIDGTTPNKVSDRFDRLNIKSPILGLTYEAQCFAVEKKALRILGWSRRVAMTKIIEEVWKAGQSGPVMPKSVFLQLIQCFMKEPETSDMAFKVVGHVTRLTRKKS